MNNLLVWTDFLVAFARPICAVRNNSEIGTIETPNHDEYN